MKLTFFLDDRYGRSVVVTDYFPDVKKFIKSVKTIRNWNFALLKNWRPLTLLCTNYKILSKVLPSRFKNFIDLLVQVDQSYCLPDRSMLDNAFVVKDVFNVCKTYHLNVWIVSIDQKKEFDRVDHTFCFQLSKHLVCEMFFFLG